MGTDHPDTLILVNNLASLYEDLGRHGKPEPLYVRALTANERVLGATHPTTLISVNNLASLYETQGRYGEAESLYVRALTTRERLLGAEHPSTLSSVNNLASLYEVRGGTGKPSRCLSARWRVCKRRWDQGIPPPLVSRRIWRG